MDGEGQPKSVISLPKSHSDDLMVLRTRVTQQSELISMLKTRADSTLLEVQRLKEENEELCREREAAASSLAEQVQRCRSVEDHFDTLQANHQQMIEIKDEYKRDSSALRARLTALSSGGQQEGERVAELAQRDSELAELREELERARCCTATAEDRSRLLQSKVECLSQELADCQKEVEETRTASTLLEQQLRESRQCVGEVRETVQEVQGQHRKQEVEWKQEMAQFTQQVARLAQEVAEQKEVVKVRDVTVCGLESELSVVKEERTQLMEELSRKREELSARAALDELQQLREEFAAYKSHMSSLLEQERGLNRKLRRMIE